MSALALPTRALKQRRSGESSIRSPIPKAQVAAVSTLAENLHPGPAVDQRRRLICWRESVFDRDRRSSLRLLPGQQLVETLLQVPVRASMALSMLAPPYEDEFVLRQCVVAEIGVRLS